MNSSPWSEGRGGGNIAVHHHATELTKLGHDVLVLYSKDPKKNIEADVNYRVKWVRHFNWATLNLNIFSFRFVLNRLLNHEQFDIIHGNAEESCLFRSLVSKYQIPYVYTSHSNIIPNTGILLGLSRPFHFLKRVNCYLQRHSARIADRIITFSEFSKKLVVRGLGENITEKIDTISPGIDSSWFQVKRCPSSKKEILLWGRMEDQKGIIELLKALSIVREDISDFRLRLVGEGSLAEKYIDESRKLGLKNHVQFLGWKSPRQIQELSAECRVGVFPSKIESFGLAIAEALASGLPVIANKVGAIPEFLEDGVTGTLVKPGDIPSLADSIKNVLNHQDKYEKMGQRAKDEMLKRFSWSESTKRIVQVYKNVIEYNSFKNKE